MPTNCGVMYDCIGLAVDLWTEVTVSRTDVFAISAEGNGSAKMPTDASNLLMTGVRVAYDVAGKPMPPLRYHIVSHTTYARWPGSSSVGVVDRIIARLVLARHWLSVWGLESRLQITVTIESCSWCRAHG